MVLRYFFNSTRQRGFWAITRSMANWDGRTPSGLKKAVESVKQFLSKTEDMFRPAYGRVVETFKRQCIFFGTTNKEDFLRDASGNRRFMPIDVNPCHGNALR